MPRPKRQQISKKTAIQSKIICQSSDCKKAGKEQPTANFYNTNSNIMPKYPVCKECLQNKIIPTDLHSVYKVLKDMDIAFIKFLWDSVCDKSSRPFGQYLRQMNSLPQYKGLQWSGSVFSNENNDIYDENGLIYSQEWMGSYTQADIDYLNEYLKELQHDFKVVTKSHKDYAKKICKASLAMDKAYEDMLNGGSEGKYKSMKEIFDSLSKSAQFAESERGINDVSLGCFGVVFDKVEKRLYVPQHIPENKDMFDNLLEQFSNINKSL